MHCQLLNQIFVSAFSGNQDADTRTVLVAAQNVAFQNSDTTDVDVLADFSNQRNTFFFELRFQNFNVGDFTCNSGVQYFVGKCTETTIFSSEVSLAVNFQNVTVDCLRFLVLITPSAATLPAFFAALIARRIYACFRLPARCRHSLPVSAFLQSIMPAPVRSRSSFHQEAVISAILKSSGDVDTARPTAKQRKLKKGPIMGPYSYTVLIRA